MSTELTRCSVLELAKASDLGLGIVIDEKARDVIGASKQFAADIKPRKEDIVE